MCGVFKKRVECPECRGEAQVILVNVKEGYCIVQCRRGHWRITRKWWGIVKREKIFPSYLLEGKDLSFLYSGGERPLKIYTDGRPTKIAFLIEGHESHTVEIPYSTNFEAEYKAIIAALKWLVSHKERFRPGETVEIMNDNATVIGQIIGKARIFEPRLKVLYDEVVSNIARFPYGKYPALQFRWIPKEQNKAHELFR